MGLCLLSVVATMLPADYGRWPGRVVRTILTPMGDAGMYLTTGLRGRIERITGPSEPPDRQAEDLIGALTGMIEDKERRLNEMREWRSELGGDFLCKLIDARVVGVDGQLLRQRRTIGFGDGVSGRGQLVTTRRVLHGRSDALPEKLLVLGRNYVVGSITDSRGHTATLQLVTDPAFQMPARLWRMVKPDGERSVEEDIPGLGPRPRTYKHSGRSRMWEKVGPPVAVLAKGNGKEIVLAKVPRKHGVEPGDLLASGSDSALLPFDVRIGAVTRTEPDAGEAHFVTVYVKPLAKLSTLRDVYIVQPIAGGG